MIAMDHRLVCFVVTLSLAALAHAERPEGVCTPPAPARATLARDTARLARAPRVRDVLRAGPLLDEIDGLCEATRALFATCPSRLVAPLHAVTLACDRATAELEIAIEREDAIREGRRALRGLDADEEARDYPELVGTHEHAQLEALRAFPASVEAFGARLVEFEAAVADEAERMTLAPAFAALAVVRARLDALVAAMAPARGARRR